MSKIWLIALASILTIASVITPAFASSVHFKGDHSLPSFTDNTGTPNPLTLTASGAISGLGFGDVNITITATAQPTAVCGNPGSKQTQAPGQNPAVVTVSGSQAIPASEVKNGNVAFSVTTSAPTNPIPGAPGCPNTSWTETITDLAFLTAIVTVQQPPGTVVLTASCSFSPPTTGGPVPSGNVSCTVTP